MIRYGSFIFLLACIDGKLNSDFLDTEPDETLSDLDGDGFTPAEGDCDDENAVIFPGATDRCDGIDNNCDDVIDEESIYWDWNGKKAVWSVGEHVQSVLLEIDSENWLAEPFSDGMIDSSIEYVYEEGRRTSELRTRGSQEIQISYTYNEEGWLMEEIWGTTQVLRHVRYSYDSLGSLLRIDTDDGGDGVIEEQSLFQYENDMLVAQDEREDGILTSSQTWTYEDGMLISMSIQGEESSIEYRYSGLPQDGIRSVIVDIDTDGSIDEEYMEWYDDEGRVFKEGRDFDGFEGFEQIASWEYGNRGLNHVSRQQPSMGNVEYIDIQEEGPHQYTVVHDVDSSFWQQGQEQYLTIRCEVAQPKTEE